MPGVVRIGYWNIALTPRTIRLRRKELEMFEQIKNRKAGLGYVWIRSESGSTYLCPAAAAAGMTSATDEELSAIGVDESLNPQND